VSASGRGAPRGSFVGRAGELRRLEAAFAAAAEGRGATLLIAGEAGIGKTRLAAELGARARGAGATVLTGRCIDLVGAGLPYLPLVEALRPLPGAPRAARALADVPGGLRELPRLLPELAPPDGPGRPAEGGPDSQLRLFAEALAVLERLGGAAPLMLVFDDLHWADGSTLDLVAFLARAIPHRRLVLVATYRSDEVRPGDPLQRLVAALVRAGEAEVVQLGPLGAEEVERLLAGLVQEDQEGRPGAVLPPEQAAAISARSEGNPFFAEELLAAAVRGEATLPGLVRDVLLQRVARLDADGRALLRVAAAAGRDVPYGLLAAVAALPEPALTEALRQAVEHAVLVPDQAAGTYRFRHALLAEAVYATLLPGEREENHGRLARALAADPRLGASRATAGELARHWAAAGRPAEALAASLRAAREAEAVSGLAEARRHLERALDLWEQVPRAGEVAGRPRAAVLAWGAELTFATGGATRAATLVRRALELVDEGADPRGAGLLYERLGSYLLPTGDRRGALAALRRAVALVPPEPPSGERATVLAALGSALMLSGRHAESLGVCRQAIAVAETSGDERPALRAMAYLGADLCYLGRRVEGMAHLLEAFRRAEAHGTPGDVARNLVFRSHVLLKTGRLREAAQVALEGLAVVRRLGQEGSTGIILAANAAEALVGTGDWARADEVLAAALRTGAANWAHFLHLQRAQLAIVRGDFEAGRRHLEAGAEGARDPQSEVAYVCLQAELAIWEGRPEAAAGAVEAGLRGPAARGTAFERSRLHALGTRAAAEQAQQTAIRRDPAAAEAARQRARRLLEEAHQAATDTVPLTPDAAAWLVVAEAECRRAEGHPAPELWQATAAAWDLLERPYLGACGRWRQAEALVAAGRPAEAARPAREAFRVASQLGARALQRELELLAQRARLDLVGLPSGDGPDGRPPAAHGLGLTAREAEVLQLLGRGYTNREIATALTISVKTASVHVTHILHKLGVTRRLDAAALAQRLTSEAPPPSAPASSPEAEGA
jgi:DNA-binding CsgD family transcriptional regulator/tetratricopeptide (TPR) repeat protein